MDSGATHHVTNSAQILDHHAPFSGNDTFRVGNGESFEIQNIGNIPLSSKTPIPSLYFVLVVATKVQ